MTYRITDLLDAAAKRLLPIVRELPDERLAGPTPCSDYTVAGLMDHLFQVVVNFQALAAKDSVDWAVRPDHLHGEWRERFAAECALLVEAWAQPGSEEGVSAGMGLPARTVGQMALIDLTVHAWDLARATDQPFEPAPETVSELAVFVETMAPTARKMHVFAAPVAVADDASGFDKILGVTGRDPEWAPTHQ